MLHGIVTSQCEMIGLYIYNGLSQHDVSYMPESAITDPGLRTHSCWRTAAYYAAWLGVPETTIKV